MNQSIKEKGGRRKERKSERHRAKLPRANRIKGLKKELGEITERWGWGLGHSSVMTRFFLGPWTPKSSDWASAPNK